MTHKPTTMRAMVYRGVATLSAETRPLPVPAAGELLIRVAACGICGTDTHIYQGQPGAAEVKPPTILGHEFSGHVAAVGPAVEGFEPGMLVAVDPNDNCGACPACRDGRVHFCRAMRGIGTTVDGAFAEYVCVPAKQALRVPPGLDPLAAAMMEPVACCLHGIDRCQLRAGEAVAVIGAGMIGLIMLQLARLQGASHVVVIEPVAARRAQAEALGADLVLDPTGADEQALRAAIRAAGIERLAPSSTAPAARRASNWRSPSPTRARSSSASG